MKIIEFYTRPLGIYNDCNQELYEMYVNGEIWNSEETESVNNLDMKMISHGYDVVILLEETDELDYVGEDYYCNIYIDDKLKMKHIPKKKADKYIQQYKEKIINKYNNFLWDALKEHFGHRVEIACYGDVDDPVSITLEDVDTNEVIIDAELCTLTERK